MRSLDDNGRSTCTVRVRRAGRAEIDTGGASARARAHARTQCNAPHKKTSSDTNRFTRTPYLLRIFKKHQEAPVHGAATKCSKAVYATWKKSPFGRVKNFEKIPTCFPTLQLRNAVRTTLLALTVRKIWTLKQNTYFGVQYVHVLRLKTTKNHYLKVVCHKYTGVLRVAFRSPLVQNRSCCTTRIIFQIRNVSNDY